MELGAYLFSAALCALTASARRGPHHPRGEPPVSRTHHHHHVPIADTSLTQDQELLHDKQHLEEDLRELTQEALDRMTPEELEFHYFSVHDFDHNEKLDGLELLKAVFHTMEHHNEDEDEKPLDVEFNDINSYIELVDRTLKSDDKDGDGFVSYAEYRAVRAKRHHAQSQANQGQDQDHKGRQGQAYQGHQDQQMEHEPNESRRDNIHDRNHNESSRTHDDFPEAVMT